MSGQYKIKIGVVPTRRGISSNRKGAFTLEDAVKIKGEVMQSLCQLIDEQVELVNIDWFNEEGILSDISQADAVSKRLQEESIDGVFILHCNFGCEEAVGKLCRIMQKPVLLWGPRDEKISEDGSRSTDTQCGLFASSRILLRYGVKFTYIENCRLADDRFRQGFQNFLSVVTVVKAFKNLRIGQINCRPKYFTSVMYNESELMEKFGIEVVPINIGTISEKMAAVLAERSRDLALDVQEIGRRMDCSKTQTGDLEKIAALKIAVRELASENGCVALAAECWTLMPLALGILPCLVIAELTDAGIPVACETDINGVITSILLQAASRGKTATFFGEYTMRHPENDHAELIWHCGPFPYSLKKESSKAELIAGRASWEIKGGAVTLARFDGDRGEYKLFAGEAQGIPGPYTTGTYLWVETGDWVKWERKLIEGPYIHHVTGVHGHFADILREACKYIPGLAFDGFNESGK